MTSVLLRGTTFPLMFLTIRAIVGIEPEITFNKLGFPGDVVATQAHTVVQYNPSLEELAEFCTMEFGKLLINNIQALEVLQLYLIIDGISAFFVH